MNTIRPLIASVILLSILLSASIFAAPKTAKAQGGSISCAASSVAAALGYTKGIGEALAAAKAVLAARLKAAVTDVPAQSVIGDTAGDTLQPGATQAQTSGSVFGKIWDNFKENCLDPLMSDMAKYVIKQLRNMIITWINTGEFGGKPTFVTNFEFDAKKTAENAARLFASELTGIDFCNYFPRNPAVNLDFSLNLKLGLECSVQKSRPQFLAGLANPDLLNHGEKLALFLREDTDPLLAEIQAKYALEETKAAAKEARRTEVVSGKGFPGIDTCVRQEVVVEGGYFHQASGERCDVESQGDFVDIPEGCVYQAAQTVCAEKKKETPGSFIADIATEPFRSELRELEAVDEFEEAVTAIVNALIGKVIGGGLNKIFSP